MVKTTNSGKRVKHKRSEKRFIGVIEGGHTVYINLNVHAAKRIFPQIGNTSPPKSPVVLHGIPTGTYYSIPSRNISLYEKASHIYFYESDKEVTLGHIYARILIITRVIT